MKEYPTIPQSIGTAFRELPNVYVFDKLDGSNLRFEWSKKKSWYKLWRGISPRSPPHSIGISVSPLSSIGGQTALLVIITSR